MAREQATFGTVDPRELERIVVVSPHLDDAALGAAHLLSSHPGTSVLTVFAGAPASYPSQPTSWDAAGGFSAGDDVAALRRREDATAMEVMGASPLWLDHVDHQYLSPHERAPAALVAADLGRHMVDLRPTAVFLPMGLANPDHVTTHEAGMLVRGAMGDEDQPCAWFCYEDSGYKHIPGLLAWRVAKLFRSGSWPTPAMVPVIPDMEIKRQAIECYVSQLGPLRRDHALAERLEANVPEQYWRLASPPQGWDALADA